MALGWIGAGKMGLPMAGRLVDAGYRLTVLEPNPANRAAAVARGALAVDGMEALAAASNAIFVTIPDDAALRQVVLGEGGLARHVRAGQTVVEMSTVSPAASAEVARALEPTGAAYLRAPVSGSTSTAEAGALTVLASGPRAAFEAMDAVLATFAHRRFHVGEACEARYLKLVLNSLVGATAALMAEALSLGRQGGLSVPDMMAVIEESAVSSPLIGYKRAMLESGDYSPAFTVAQMAKDFDLILDAAASGEVPMKLLPIVRTELQAAIDAGKANRDFFVLADRVAHDSTAPERAAI